MTNKSQWQKFKDSISSDLKIRFANEIEQGKVRLVERKDTSWRAFLVDKAIDSTQDKVELSIAIFGLCFIIGLHYLGENNKSCIFLEYWSVDVALYMTWVVFFVIFMFLGALSMMYKGFVSKNVNHWQVDKHSSSRLYVVERYYSGRQLKLKKLVYLLASIALFVFVGYFIYLINNELIHGRSFIEINQIAISQCENKFD